MSAATHRTHCCATHGCKYGPDYDCPVANRTLTQAHPCEECAEGTAATTDAFYDGEAADAPTLIPGARTRYRVTYTSATTKTRIIVELATQAEVDARITTCERLGQTLNKVERITTTTQIDDITPLTTSGT